MQKAVDARKKSTAQVVMLYAFDIDLSPFVLEMVYHNISDRTWIASEASLSPRPSLLSLNIPHIFCGSIGFAIPRADIPGLK